MASGTKYGKGRIMVCEILSRCRLSICGPLSVAIVRLRDANDRHVGALLAAALLLVGAGAKAGEFASVDEATASFSTNSCAARESAFRYVLGRSRTMDAHDVRTVLGALRTMSQALGRATEYEEACRAGMSADDELVRFTCASALLLSSSAAADCARCVRQVEESMASDAAFLPAHRLDLVKAVADIRLQRLADAEGAIAGLDRAIGLVKDDMSTALQLRLKKIDLLRAAKMDAELEREARPILGMADCPSQAYQAAAFALADLAASRGDAKAAGELLLGSISRTEFAPPGIARRLVAASVDDATIAAAVVALRRQLAALPLADAGTFCSAVERTQPEIVELLGRLGRHDEALAECRVLLLSVSPRNYRTAVVLTASALKLADGNLGRALAFVDFQRKDVVPKVRNPVLDAPRLSDGVRAELRRALPVGSSGNWSVALAVAARLVWLDDPQAAVREALRAFALAPLDERSLQICADAAMRPVLAATRDPADAKALVDFLMYGENGSDGAKGTSDDLPSPDERLAAALRIGRED